MKITDVRAIHVALPQIASRSDGTQDALMILVDTDAGITGIGEVDSSPLVAKAAIEAPMSHSIATGLREVLIGRDPREIQRLWHDMYQASRYAGRRGVFVHAISGVDLALWDILGKSVDLPVHTLLGGAHRTKIRAYASTLFQDSLAATADRARWCVDQGFTAVKFGWDPMGQDPDYDEALVAAIREAVGDDVEVLIDAGQCWDTKTAVQMARRFEPYRPYWLEEPLHPDNVEGYGILSRTSPLRIAAGEAEDQRHSYRHLMDVGMIDVVQIDVTRCGGLTEAKRIAGEALDRGREVINHSFTTDVNVAASAALLATLPRAPFLEYCVEDTPIRNALCKNPPLVEDGFVVLPQEPGLGVEIDMDALERLTVKVA